MSESNAPELTPWIVAVDGGGSKIAVAGHEWVDIDSDNELHSSVRRRVAESDMRLWHFEGTGSAHPSTWSQAANNLVLAINEVAANLSENTAKISVLKLALAGAGRADDQARVIEALRARCPFLAGVQIQCMGDIEPLVDYNVGCERSIAVILGTGSVVASRSATGELIRAGGWGPLLGDACSGGAIGLSALRYLSQLLDEGQTLEQFSEMASALVNEIRALHMNSSVGLNSLLIQTASDRMQTAKLSGVVLSRAYQLADRTAMEMIEPHLADIVWQIRQVARRSGINDEVLSLNFTGGIAENHQPLRQAIKQACLAAGLNVQFEKLVDPLQALLSKALQPQGASRGLRRR